MDRKSDIWIVIPLKKKCIIRETEKAVLVEISKGKYKGYCSWINIRLFKEPKDDSYEYDLVLPRHRKDGTDFEVSIYSSEFSEEERKFIRKEELEITAEEFGKLWK